MEPKQNPALDRTGDGSKVQSYKEQYCIVTWNVRSMNKGKLEVVKQMARVNIYIPIPYDEKDIFFCVLVLECLIVHHRTIQLQLLCH